MRKNTLKMDGKAGSITHDAALQKITMLSHSIDRMNIIATVSYNIDRMRVYIHFSPDFPVSFYDLGQVAAYMAKLGLKKPFINFRNNMIECAL